MCEVIGTPGYYLLFCFRIRYLPDSAHTAKGWETGLCNDQLRVGFLPELSDRGTFGSYRCLTRRYDNYADVTFDIFSLNKSSGGLASQNHVE